MRRPDTTNIFDGHVHTYEMSTAADGGLKTTELSGIVIPARPNLDVNREALKEWFRACPYDVDWEHEGRLPHEDRLLRWWIVDEGLVEFAAREVSIERPVKVRLTRGSGASAGVRGDYPDAAWEHVIYMGTDQGSLLMVSRSFWHELAHCAQRERHENFDALYQEAGGGVGKCGAHSWGSSKAQADAYAANRFEKEARELARACPFSLVAPASGYPFDLRECASCGQDCSLDEFPRNSRAKDGRGSKCHWCVNYEARSRRSWRRALDIWH